MLTISIFYDPVDSNAEHIKYATKKDNSAATMIGAVVGCLCFVGVAIFVGVGAAIYLVKKRKKYEKVPLLVDEYVRTFLENWNCSKVIIKLAFYFQGLT